MSGRSYLYVPGDQPAKLERALEKGADALIVDLEDGVAPSSKAEARTTVAAWLARLPVGPTGPTGSAPPREVWVRINPLGSAPLGAWTDDLDATVGPALDGICLAKCQSAAEATALDDALGEREDRLGLPAGSIRISALVESASGLLDAPAIATLPRVDRLQLGEADLTAELGISAGHDESELLALRTAVVVASAAAGLEGPIGPVSTDFRDLEAFRAGTERLKRLGFRGRAVIHPAQIPVVNEAFTPSPSEEAAARAIVECFDAAVANGNGVVVDDGGRMVDEAVVRAARRVLAQAGRAEHSEGR